VVDTEVIGVETAVRELVAIADTRHTEAVDAQPLMLNASDAKAADILRQYARTRESGTSCHQPKKR
jgi:hypothetical protein